MSIEPWYLLKVIRFRNQHYLDYAVCNYKEVLLIFSMYYYMVILQWPKRLNKTNWHKHRWQFLLSFASVGSILHPYYNTRYTMSRTKMLTGWSVSIRPGQPATHPAGCGLGWTSDRLRAHGLVISRVYGFVGRVYTLTCYARVNPRVTNFVFHTTYSSVHFSLYSFVPPLF